MGDRFAGDSRRGGGRQQRDRDRVLNSRGRPRNIVTTYVFTREQEEQRERSRSPQRLHEAEAGPALGHGQDSGSHNSTRIYQNISLSERRESRGRIEQWMQQMK